MKKVQYINAMPYIYDASHKGACYLIEGAKGYCNHGNLCESIAKYHRGVEYFYNPNTGALDGYDIPAEMAEVKSAAAALGRCIGSYNLSASEQIKFYFAHKPSNAKWIWVELNEKTQEVTEYHMTKSEFGAFMHLCLRAKVHKYSNGKSECVRFKKTNKAMIEWLESKCN